MNFHKAITIEVCDIHKLLIGNIVYTCIYSNNPSARKMYDHVHLRQFPDDLILT